MDVRAHVSMVFHLDKCIGCHTCSVACKNIWTTRDGAEYMWWNNVETKPGTGFPTRWEDQERFKGGWERDGKGSLKLKGQNRLNAFLHLFYNPHQPGMDDYYEPWTYDYKNLFDAPEGDDQPSARPISRITGETMDIKGGPNWDDDLSGSALYAENDPNLEALSEDDRNALMEVERLTMFYLPRICNHCANPSCVASCPSGALYKRGEDGIVLINQEKCRGWRACVSACPYKKIYYNWKSGKSEKCILCFPRLETGQAPACFHSCVGRIRYMGVLLYDADRIPEAMDVPDHALVESQRNAFLDPFDPNVIEAAKKNGISDEFLDAAQKSPVYQYVVEWKLALPLHAEYRTMPMLFYVPPLLPVMGRVGDGIYSHEHAPEEFFAPLSAARLPIEYLASLFGAGNREPVEAALKRMMAVRYYMRTREIDDIDPKAAHGILREAGINEEMAEAIYRLTTLASSDSRWVMPPLQAEEGMQTELDPEVCKGCSGLGYNETPVRSI